MNLKQKINSLFIACILVVLSAATALAAPDVSADAAIVIDRNSGAVLYEKNPDKREYPASMTKMMTCILALENSKPDRIVEVSANAADVECTRLYPGYQLRMADILKQMMLISDNGCATAIGESWYD